MNREKNRACEDGRIYKAVTFSLGLWYHRYAVLSSIFPNTHGKAETEACCSLLEFYKEIFLRNIPGSSW